MKRDKKSRQPLLRANIDGIPGVKKLAVYLPKQGTERGGLIKHFDVEAYLLAVQRCMVDAFASLHDFPNIKRGSLAVGPDGKLLRTIGRGDGL
ncbi:MAG: hypothetical protein NT163_11075 [Chlorobiales bacterium]|nr:hypothetical protein [Chlorobiales bacterium]